MCFLLSQCSVNKTSTRELTLEDSICYIDTSRISPQLKQIVKSYIRTYPQFENLVLMHDNFALKNKHKDMDIDELYVLGPTFMGESYVREIYPAFFFTINGKIVFVKSFYDRFMNQELCESAYMKHLEINMLFSKDEGLFWLIRIEELGSVSVLTKHPDEYLGIEEVKGPNIHFTAPVSQKSIE